MIEPDQDPGPSARQRAAGWALVTVQGALLVGLVWPVDPGGDLADWLRWVGTALRALGLVVVAVGAAGLGGSLTPSPVPKATGALVTRGLYRRVRHPIYSGLLLFAVGAVLSNAHAVRVGAAVGLWALLEVKSRWEERLLVQRLPGYAAYAASVGRFVPRLR